MDPDVALYGFIAAVAEGDSDGADEYFDALSTWLRSGGFEPKWQPHERRLFRNYRKEESAE